MKQDLRYHGLNIQEGDVTGVHRTEWIGVKTGIREAMYCCWAEPRHMKWSR